MVASTKTMLAAMFCMAGLTLAQAQEPVTKANMVKITATIQAIDQTTRTITLRDDKGNEDTFTAGEAVKRFNELKVGQKVNISYYESIVFQRYRHRPTLAFQETGATMRRIPLFQLRFCASQ